MSTTKVIGGPALRKALARLPGDVDDLVRDVVAEAAAAVVTGTRNRVAFDTGNLYRGVESEPAADGLSAEVGWGDPDEFYATFPELGTSSQAKQPALQPALDEEARLLPDRIEAAARRRWPR